MASNVTIKAIEASAVHQIQSGQVIVDLCSVAKELVENSLDAGATSVDIRFKNQGLDSIEVQDNGSGISSANYESIALKHYTSKLSDYADLTTLQTFGFRGEALSSLCALSKFTIVTCTQEEAPKAKRLEFEASGKLKSATMVSGQRGTTVSVENLFYNLPVRRRELERNIKREWGKVTSLLNQYACIQTGVKITVSQQPNKGKKMVIFSTKGNMTTRENIVNVFGVKTMNALVPLDLKLELEPTRTRTQLLSSGDGGGTTEIRVRGHVSRPAHGEGRQTPDRQMFYVNGRPCGLPQFAKVFNEVYRSYNSSQSPFIFADIQLDTHLYDVNVSPDKRTILLHDQGRMLDNLRESLIEAFETQDVTIPIAQLPGPKQLPPKKPTASRPKEPVSDVEDDSEVSAGHESEGPDEAAASDSSDEDGSSGDPGASRTSARRKLPSKKTTSSASLAQSSTSLGLMSRWLDKKPSHSETTNSAQSIVAPVAQGDASNPRPADSHDESAPSSPEAEAPPKQAVLPRDLSGESAETRKRHIAEPPIPSISPSRSHVPSSAPRILTPTKLPSRSAAGVATIIIGDHGMSESPVKRLKTEGRSGASQPSSSVARPAGTAKKPVPSFGGRLTQLFSAAGSERNHGKALEVTSDTIEDEDDDELMFPADEAEVEDDEEPEDEAGEQPELTAEEAPDDVDGLEEGDVGESAGVDDRQETEDVDEEERNSPEEATTESVDADAAADTTIDGEKRTQMLLKGVSKRKDSTLRLLQQLSVGERSLEAKVLAWQRRTPVIKRGSADGEDAAQLDVEDAQAAEKKLSLKISKDDFGRMEIIGQFNLGFILAVRDAPAKSENDNQADGVVREDDELFIIDQHASDEKYNFEKLSANTVVQSQRLVQPKTLELTALEEEIIMENLPVLETNGFIVRVDNSGNRPVGSRCQLLSLPLSRETTFSLADLEELVVLIGDNPAAGATTVPRPAKVRKMLAMRACRSSVMIGKALSLRQMEKVVRHMGEMEKPWNCPHGRPTMRHLSGLNLWDEKRWQEDSSSGSPAGIDWASYVRQRRAMAEGDAGRD